MDSGCAGGRDGQDGGMPPTHEPRERGEGVSVNQALGELSWDDVCKCDEQEQMAFDHAVELISTDLMRAVMPRSLRYVMRNEDFREQGVWAGLTDGILPVLEDSECARVPQAFDYEEECAVHAVTGYKEGEDCEYDAIAIDDCAFTLHDCQLMGLVAKEGLRVAAGFEAFSGDRIDGKLRAFGEEYSDECFRTTWTGELPQARKGRY